MVVAPSHLDQHGPIELPRDLARCRTIQATNSNDGQAWDYVANSKRQTVTVKPALCCNTIEATLVAAKSGWGVSRAISYQVADTLNSGEGA